MTFFFSLWSKHTFHKSIVPTNVKPNVGIVIHTELGTISVSINEICFVRTHFEGKILAKNDAVNTSLISYVV